MIVTQLVLAFCVGFSLAQEAPEKKEAVELDGKDGAGPAGTDRSKRLFFVSTTSSTSTLVTRFTCYLTKAALVSCKKRRRRSYLEESPDQQPQSFAEEAILPARIQPITEGAEDESSNLAPGFNEVDAKQYSQQGFSLSPKALKMKALISLQ